MDHYNDFFTLQSLGTFAGAVGATTVVSNGLQRALDFNPKWLALALAEVICLAIVFYSHTQAGADARPMSADYFVALINGFLVFCSAAGATAAAAQAANKEPTTKGPGVHAPKREFWSNWY